MNESTATNTKKEEDTHNVSDPHHQQHQFSVLHGLQCIAALGLVFFHVHLLEGSHFFLSTDSCMLAKHNLPILGNLLFNISFHMTTFWFVSGFFCERQLSQQRRLQVLQVKRATTNEIAASASARPQNDQDVRLGFYDYARVFFNHILRRYPLVAMMTVLMFLGKRRSSSNHSIDSVWPQELECSVPLFFQSLLLLVPVNEAEKCMGPGWAVVAETHGILALLLASALVANRQVRKRLLVVAYAASVGWCWYTYQSLQLAHPEAVQRLKSSSSSSLVANLGYDHFAHFERLGQDLKAEFNLMSGLYSHVDFEDPGLLAVQNYRLAARGSLYQTSIHKHGSSMLLGCLLYMNLQDRQQQLQRTQQQRNGLAFCKLVLALVLLVATKFLHFMTGMSLYLLADALLSMWPRQFPDQKKKHSSLIFCSSSLLTRLRNNLLILCSNLLSRTKWMAPYTFGIYMVNLVVIMKRKQVIFQQRLNQWQEQGQDVHLLCRDYDMSFLVRETIRTFTTSLLISMILYHSVEWPLRHLRRWIQLRLDESATTTSTSKKTA